MRALLFGVAPGVDDVPDDATALRRALASSPMDLVDVADPPFLRPDWVVLRPRLTGICGSDAKQAFMDWGEMSAHNPMVDFTSFPHILGHEVVAEVAALGPEAVGVDVGDRVVLDPWLGCVPRGVAEVCPACAAGDNSLCWNFRVGPISAGIHSGTSSDASGGFAELMPAHPSMLHPVPDGLTDEVAVLADPFAVSLHSVVRHPPPPSSRVVVYGAGALGSAAVAVLRALFPDVEVGVVARFDAQASLARALGAARVFAHEPVSTLIEEIAEWSGGVLQATTTCRWPIPAGSISSTTPSAARTRSRWHAACCGREARS